MKASFIITAIFSIIILAGGCAVTEQKLIPATDPNVSTNFIGFSVEPPDGQNWFIKEQTYFWPVYIKMTELKEKHSVIAMALSIPVDLEFESIKDFMEYAEKISKIERSDSRFRAVNENVSLIKVDRAECVRVDFSAEDHGVPFTFGSAYFLQGFDILCLHPDFPYMLIRFGYSQRFEKGKTPLALESEINSFIESITFDEDIKNRDSIGPLLGIYAYDKFIFFPEGRNYSKEKLLMNALKEGGYKEAEIYRQSATSEQMLAIEYDGASLVRSMGYPGFGSVLGKVGRWKEAFKVFKIMSAKKTQSSEIMGNVGVASHVIGNFGESVKYFQKAKTIDPDYFKNKRQQQKMFGASQEGVSVFSK